MPTALILLVKGSMGVGAVGSVHVLHRNEEVEYSQQLVRVNLPVSEVDPQWIILGGDWTETSAGMLL